MPAAATQMWKRFYLCKVEGYWDSKNCTKMEIIRTLFIYLNIPLILKFLTSNVSASGPLAVPHTRLFSMDGRSFIVMAPKLWNVLHQFVWLHCFWFLKILAEKFHLYTIFLFFYTFWICQASLGLKNGINKWNIYDIQYIQIYLHMVMVLPIKVHKRRKWQAIS